MSAPEYRVTKVIHHRDNVNWHAADPPQPGCAFRSLLVEHLPDGTLWVVGEHVDGMRVEARLSPGWVIS